MEREETVGRHWQLQVKILTNISIFVVLAGSYFLRCICLELFPTKTKKNWSTLNDIQNHSTSVLIWDVWNHYEWNEVEHVVVNKEGHLVEHEG